MSRSPKVIAIVQARMDSSRLPGKVLADIEGEPMLARVVRRLTWCTRVRHVVVATTADEADDPVGAAAESAGVPRYRFGGDPNDVLGRYAAAARCHGADVVVRVTADCPLIDPALVDRMVEMLVSNPQMDYASNVVERTFPRGLDVEAFWLDTLLRLDRKATDPADREHVTRLLLRRGRPAYTTSSLTTSPDRGRWRWTVDTQADLDYVRLLYRCFRLGKEVMPWQRLADWLEQGDMGTVPIRLETDEPRRTVAA